MSNFVKHNVYLPGSNRCIKKQGGVRVGTSFNEGIHNSDIVVQSTNCPVKKKVTITNTNFDVGHVLSEKNGGTHEINNLRPICGACNHSMGYENIYG